MKVATIVLAAGGSSRMGAPKQLLRWKKVSLIRHAVMTALCCNSHKTFVVLGNQHERIKLEIDHFPVRVVINLGWRSGLSSSIRCGLSAAMKEEKLDGALLVLADQPLMQCAILNELVARFEDSYDLVATSYGDHAGVPAIFPSRLFDQLLELEADQGAKKIIKANCKQVVTPTSPSLLADIDTPEDYEHMRKTNV